MVKNKINLNYIFELVHFNEDICNKYFEGYEELKSGLILENQNLESFKNWIKQNIAISDSYFFNELINFKYHIHSNSEILISFLNEKKYCFFSELIRFDDLNRFLTNDTLLIESLKDNKDFSVSISLKNESIFQANMSHILLNPYEIPEFYLNQLIIELLNKHRKKTEFLALYSKEARFDFNKSIDFIYSLIEEKQDLSLLYSFKESFDIFYVISCLKLNFWNNSNL